MGNCLDRGGCAIDDEECRQILRDNPWMRKLPFIGSVSELQPLLSLCTFLFLSSECIWGPE